MKIVDSRGDGPSREKPPARQDPPTLSGSFSSRVLNELMDCIEEFVLILDTGLRVIEANRGALISLGYAKDKMISKHLSLLVDMEERTRILNFIRGAKKRRIGSASFLTRLRKTVPVRFSVSPIADAGGKAQGYLLIGRLARMENFNPIPESANFLVKRMLNSFADPLFIIDGLSRTVLDCNTAALDALGFPREDVVGWRFLDHLAHGKQRERNDALGAKVDKAYAELGMFQGRLLCRQRNGPDIPFDLFCLPLFNPDGTLSFIIAMLFDRSFEEAREAELALLLDRANSLISDLSVIVNRPAQDEVRRLSDLGFTARQIEIARLVERGISSKDIGFQLGIAESTVRNHLAVMFRKLGVDSRISFLHVLNEQRIRIS